MAATPQSSADQAQFIVETYFLDAPTELLSFGMGAINETFLVRANARTYILQRMNALFPPQTTTDFIAVTNHLRQCGWEMPQLIPTKQGEEYATHGAGDWWRLMTFIESDNTKPTTLAPEQYTVAGRLLGRLHADLSQLPYEPVYTIAHFHDTTYYANQLEEVVHGLNDVQEQQEQQEQQAQQMLAALTGLTDLPGSKPQLIHGDPQTSNMLFRSGLPFTFIDFDTVMRASIWIDIGDMLRSLAEDSIEHGKPFPAKEIEAVAQGYYAEMNVQYSEAEFLHYALQATQKIALELGMRFMTDIVDDSYFGFDARKFANRRESNSHRAEVQWRVYKQCQEAL